MIKNYTRSRSNSFTILSTILFLALLAASGKAYVTDHVVLVIIDGLRYSEGLGDPTFEHVPRMGALATEGALINDFQNDGDTYTSRAIPAIWCGAWTDINTFSDPDCNGSSNNTTELPTFFEYYRKQLSRPAEDCVYTLKALCPWKASLDPDYGTDFWPLYHSVGSTDIDVGHETEQVISDLAPHFLLMYLADVDSKGHSGDWDDYLVAISTADSLVGALWDVLQADTAYAGKTTLLVTNDHGRHDYDFTGHGDGCAGCRQIQLLAIGPDIQSGLASDIPRTIPDIAPTIGELLGFTTEDATGTAMLELLDPTAGIERNVEVMTPSSISLKRLFPTPFNSELSIEYEMLDSHLASISIFNLQGKQVWTRNVSSRGEGMHTLKWDGRDQSQNGLPSGIFIVQLSNQRLSQSQKVLLLK
ncbi:MAG: T9SS type A sorting domain-containing protein [FCB group bacterium]|nr:T9SS type A sorting domain-containing protein [FCB group bacterium]MBL7028709.1 T9SS type A sorting domain-containing protein [Candidatus Neomarinimicrobiota bacterium]MBL7120687.1 T9SS type A sorting domain-containing protein [Candidatus Neomarinimicrobiota bacterium]